MNPRHLATAALLALVVFVFNVGSVVAQQDELTVVDEVIAQVNDEVITLSMLKRRMNDSIEALKQGGMTEQRAAEEVRKRQAQLVVTLINETLLLQRGKDMGLGDEIDAEVNRRMLQIAQEQGINSIEKLHQAMRESNLNPEEIRRTMRSEMMKEAVLQREVDRGIYLGFSAQEVKDYFERHPDKFREPAAGTPPTFNDRRVREAMLRERQAKERAAYLQNLRREAFIKVKETYRASVEPLL